jgi:hypothetical protein
LAKTAREIMTRLGDMGNRFCRLKILRIILLKNRLNKSFMMQTMLIVLRKITIIFKYYKITQAVSLAAFRPHKLNPCKKSK